MKEGGDNKRRSDGVDRTASIWLTSLGRKDDRSVERKTATPPRVMRKTRQSSRSK